MCKNKKTKKSFLLIILSLILLFSLNAETAIASVKNTEHSAADIIAEEIPSEEIPASEIELPEEETTENEADGKEESEEVLEEPVDFLDEETITIPEEFSFSAASVDYTSTLASDILKKITERNKIPHYLIHLELEVN